VLHGELTALWEQTGTTILFVTHNVREAVRLGQRVVLMSSRPGRVAREWAVDIPQPRRIEDAAVAELAREITADLHREISRHG
jgi:NitT/TauT family transport system ATP-binding protein